MKDISDICHNCLSRHLKEWANSYSTIIIEDMDDFVFEIFAFTNIFLKRTDQFNCHKNNKNDGYKILEIDIKRIKKTIESIDNNPILNRPQRESLVKSINEVKKKLESTLSKCNFDQRLFSNSIKKLDKDAQAKLVTTGKIDSRTIRDTYINHLADTFKRHTHREDTKRTKEEKRKSCTSPFFSLLKLLYKIMGIIKDDNTIQKDINNALN